MVTQISSSCAALTLPGCLDIVSIPFPFPIPVPAVVELGTQIEKVPS
jgi:hypothetical protein